jgi:prepilin-type processing-associated H-X9-DG protein
MGKRDNKLAQEKPRTSKLAIAGLALSIVGLGVVGLGLVGSCVFLAIDLAKVVSAGLVLMILGLVLSVVALAGSRRSKGQLAGRGYAIAGTIVVMVVLLPVGLARILDKTSRAKHLAPRVICGTNISGLVKATVVYANDDEFTRFPAPDQWCDLLLNDYLEKKRFVCPEAGNGRCHYAINPNAQPNSAPDMVLLFETKGGWNQFGGPEILTTENHKGEGCNVAFVDTHVEFVQTEDLGKLKWNSQDANSG